MNNVYMENTYKNENRIQAKEISKRDRMISVAGKYGLLVLTLFLFVVFAGLNSTFGRVSNLLDIVRTASIYGICALGLSTVMITGEIDFCCGMEMSLGGVALCLLLDSEITNSFFLASVIVLLLAVGLGIANWFLHCKVGIPAFIATMGTSLMVQGILMALSSSARVFSVRFPDNFKTLGSGRLFNTIPYPAICLVILCIVMLFYTESTTSGKKLYAVGSNNKACKYMGINASREKLKAFVICSVFAAFGGIIYASTNGGGIYTQGDNTLINGLTILMLSATFWHIGVFNVPGCIVGAVLISGLDNGLTILGVQTFGKYLVKGGVLLFAVYVVTTLRHSQSKGD